MQLGSHECVANQNKSAAMQTGPCRSDVRSLFLFTRPGVKRESYCTRSNEGAAFPRLMSSMAAVWALVFAFTPELASIDKWIVGLPCSIACSHETFSTGLLTSALEPSGRAASRKIGADLTARQACIREEAVMMLLRLCSCSSLRNAGYACSIVRTGRSALVTLSLHDQGRPHETGRSLPACDHASAI